MITNQLRFLKVAHISGLLIIAISFGIAAGALALPHLEKRVTIVGRSSAIITKSTIALGDIADVSAADRRDDEAVIALSQIVIEKSPQPGQVVTINGDRLVERIRAAGVDMATVRYTVPRTVAVERAGRSVSQTELEEEIRRILSKSGREAIIRQVNISGAPQIATGPVQYQLESYPSSKPGHEVFSARALQPESQPINFQVEAIIDEWREVAIAKRPIIRGAVVNADDVAMARLKTTMLPRDRSVALPDIIGLAAAVDIAAGEVFRASKLSVPVVISAGDRVTLLFRSKFMEASAQGVALENAGAGASIRVRNDGSKKVVVGRAVEPGLVSVSP